MTTIREICSCISKAFPEKAAESWDNPGLQLGRKDAVVRSILVSLELTAAVLDEAVAAGVDLIVTHHPFIFKAMKAVTDDTPEGRMLLTLAEHRIGLLAAHTNLDSAPHAIGERLGRDLGLKETRPVLAHQPYCAYKIVVFVPEAAASDVAAAMHAAGAGAVGAYSEVSFRAQGSGHFTCGSAAHPAIGTPGSREIVDEIRLEMVVSERDLDAVTRALVAAHPYEEPAYDVFLLQSSVHGLTDAYGFGVVGRLPQAMRLEALIEHIKTVWEIPSVRVAGAPDRWIESVGILNGSGARYMASCHGVDAFITGDCGHHDFDCALRLGVALIDAGHYETEKLIPHILADVLKTQKFDDMPKVFVAKSMANPMRVC